MDFKEAVDTYYTPLYRFAHSLAKNPDEAGDLVQQTFVIFAEKGHSVRESGKLKSWLFTSLYREFLRVRRRGMPMQNTDPEVLADTAPPIEAGQVTQVDSRLAVEALEQLDETYRAPLALFYLQDMSYKDIAAALEIPIGTVMSRLSRGKSQLKTILAKGIGE